MEHFTLHQRSANPSLRVFSLWQAAHAWGPSETPSTDTISSTGTLTRVGFMPTTKQDPLAPMQTHGFQTPFRSQRCYDTSLQNKAT